MARRGVYGIVMREGVPGVTWEKGVDDRCQVVCACMPRYMTNYLVDARKTHYWKQDGNGSGTTRYCIATRTRFGVWFNVDVHA